MSPRAPGFGFRCTVANMTAAITHPRFSDLKIRGRVHHVTAVDTVEIQEFLRDPKAVAMKIVAKSGDRYFSIFIVTLASK